MAYATSTDVQSRILRTLSTSEISVCTAILDDCAAIIDAFNSEASADVKEIVSCRMAIRALGNGGDNGGVPIGATQGSMSALGYSQSWTIGSGSAGEVYLSKLEKQMLGAGNAIGSYSPVEELVAEEES